MEHVQGFSYDSVSDDEPDNGLICQIVGRTGPLDASEQEILDLGPAFLVRFGDGHERTAYACELRPWYPTD